MKNFLYCTFFKFGLLAAVCTFTSSVLVVQASEEDGYQKVKSFVKNKLMGKTIEVKTKSKIDHVKYGKAETEFFRREFFIDFHEKNEGSNSGFQFRCISIIEQKIWPLDEKGNRLGDAKIDNRALVLQYELRPINAIGGAVGTGVTNIDSRGLTPASSIRMQFTMEGGDLVSAADYSPYEVVRGNETSNTKAFVTKTVYKFVNGKISLKQEERDFQLDLATMKRTPGDHSVDLYGKEVDGIMAPRK